MHTFSDYHNIRGGKKANRSKTECNQYSQRECIGSNPSTNTSQLNKDKSLFQSVVLVTEQYYWRIFAFCQMIVAYQMPLLHEYVTILAWYAVWHYLLITYSYLSHAKLPNFRLIDKRGTVYEHRRICVAKSVVYQRVIGNTWNMFVYFVNSCKLYPTKSKQVTEKHEFQRDFWFKCVYNI